MRIALAVYGVIIVATLMLWAFTGLPVWAPVADSYARGAALFFVYAAGLAAFAIAVIPTFWKDE